MRFAPLREVYEKVATGYFVAATASLMVMALLLFASAIWEVALSLRAFDPVDAALDSIGLLIIGFAVVETAKFIVEEEVFRKRELRSPMESRRSLTKFITIIVIAASLEALVMVFQTSRTNIPDVIYPAALFIASMVSLVSLGAYQWLSSRIEPPSLQDPDEALAGPKGVQEEEEHRKSA